MHFMSSNRKYLKTNCNICVVYFLYHQGFDRKQLTIFELVYVCYDSNMLELDQLVLFVRCRMQGAIVIFAPKAISIDFFIKHLHFSHNFLTFLKICRPSIKYMPFEDISPDCLHTNMFCRLVILLTSFEMLNVCQ